MMYPPVVWWYWCLDVLETFLDEASEGGEAEADPADPLALAVSVTLLDAMLTSQISGCRR